VSITVRTVTPDLKGTIDQSTSMHFKATRPANIDPLTVTVSATNQTVQEYAVFSIDF